jgi:uncharacterized protein
MQKGINGHMGSKLTANSEKMYQIFTILKQRNLYFVDSLTTTADSVCKPSSTLLKVPFAQRDILSIIFWNPNLCKQVHRLIKTAKKNGEAIGIAHPYKITFEILRTNDARN